LPVSFDVHSSAGIYSVVSERNVFGTHASAIRAGIVIADAYFTDTLAARGITTISLNANEGTKSYDALGAIIVRMRDAGVNRHTHLWAIGGGAIQDAAGFIASIFMRGIKWTYVPTTLLGMVDSCIGGKSSINVGTYKNIVGTFHPPTKVLIDPDLTATLTTEQRIAGLVEAAKICYCRGENVFTNYLALEPNIGLPADNLAPIIALSLGTKKWFVEIDEFDRAERLLLNFGHTFGHALEAASGYHLSHGVAVGVGILCALTLSRALINRAPGGAAPSLEQHLRALLCAWTELRPLLESIDVANAIDHLKADKKHDAEFYRFITVDVSGQVQVTRLPRTDATDAMVVKSLQKTLSILSR